MYWEQVVAQGIPMLCKYMEGMTHVDIGGNVRFLMEDSTALIQKELTGLLEQPEVYHNMKRAAMSTKRKDFSYREIARKCIR